MEDFTIKIWSVNFAHVENACAQGLLALVALAFFPRRRVSLAHPIKVANELIRWFEEGAVDGFMLGLPVLGFGLEDFITLVLPALSERGYHDLAQAGDTLRDHFNLLYRKSRYALTQEAAAV